MTAGCTNMIHAGSHVTL